MSGRNDAREHGQNAVVSVSVRTSESARASTHPPLSIGSSPCFSTLRLSFPAQNKPAEETRSAALHEFIGRGEASVRRKGRRRSRETQSLSQRRVPELKRFQCSGCAGLAAGSGRGKCPLPIRACGEQARWAWTRGDGSDFTPVVSAIPPVRHSPSVSLHVPSRELLSRPVKSLRVKEAPPVQVLAVPSDPLCPSPKARQTLEGRRGPREGLCSEWTALVPLPVGNAPDVGESPERPGSAPGQGLPE